MPPPSNELEVAGVSLEVIQKQIRDLRGNPRNARTHSKTQLEQLAKSIREFGFNNPILTTIDGEIIAGHGRLEAAIAAGLTSVPVIKLPHLSESQRRAFMLADNKLALGSGWDQEKLAFEVQALIDLNFDLPTLGFTVAEGDQILDIASNSSTEDKVEDADIVPELTDEDLARPGDLWLLGRHRLFCGDARNAEHVRTLMDGDVAAQIFTDPPYNVRIDGNVCGSGSIRHREFAMASGEMSNQQFQDFLAETLGMAASVCCDGAIAFVCMDWRHLGEITAAGKRVFSELKNVCVWNKKVGGMGTFYRSKHELVFVFKIGTAPHVNNFGLGENGRYRTNVWDYAGIAGSGASALADLAMHPTVKPVALVADAMKDCSKRGDIVLDVFGGSGTTLIAAQSCGRTAYLMEIDPLYCNTVIKRFEAFTGIRPVLA